MSLLPPAAIREGQPLLLLIIVDKSEVRESLPPQVPGSPSLSPFPGSLGCKHEVSGLWSAEVPLALRATL